MAGAENWRDYLVCPLDHARLDTDGEGQWICTACDFRAIPVVVDGQTRPDFRALDRPQTVTLAFQIPGVPLDRDQAIQTYFRAIQQTFDHYSRSDIRRRFGTKLDKGIQYYCQQLLRIGGPEAPILDLGCGNGGNRRYLQTLGFRNVVTVDWIARGADLLVDAHRLPFASETFQMVLSTAVFEHLYNPFIAISEIGRVLKNDGLLVGGASFWEAWHDSSYFHLTPDGWNTLCRQANLKLEDLWPGWGIIPAALAHVLTPGYFRGLGYVLQSVVESGYRLLLGSKGLRKLQLRASGSYQVCARKQPSVPRAG
jgi:SAM-dependent methyltransferase